MKRILIAPASAVGHVMPTFRIAKALQARGYHIAYLVDANIKKLVASQGFQTLDCSPALFFNADMGGIFEKRDKSIYERFLDRMTNTTLKATIQNLTKLEKTIVGFKPDLVLTDVFLTYNYILQTSERPTIFFQTMLSTYEDSQVPPLNSLTQPHQTLRIQLDWLKYKIQRQWRQAISMGESDWALTQRALKRLKRSFDKSQLTWDKCFQVGIKDVPELVLAPAEFDFPREQTPQYQQHIGPTIDLDRTETKSETYHNIIEKIKHKKIAYCSLGTLSVTHNKDSAAFLKTVAQVFQQKPDWELILSCGEADPNKLGIISPNIHLFQSVPQLDMIKNSDLVLTHGGLNTVLETITLGKPMLVFPLNKKWDQQGNAARIVYHQLGLAGDIQKTTTTELAKMVETVSENKIYTEKVMAMSRIFQQHYNNLDKAIDFIESQIPKTTQPVSQIKYPSVFC